MYTVSNLDFINRIISRRPSKRNRKRDYSHMDEKEVRRVVKDYSDMMIDKNEDGYIAGPMLQQKKF